MFYARTPQQGNGRVERATAQSTNSTTNCPHAYGPKDPSYARRHIRSSTSSRPKPPDQRIRVNAEVLKHSSNVMSKCWKLTEPTQPRTERQ